MELPELITGSIQKLQEAGRANTAGHPGDAEAELREVAHNILAAFPDAEVKDPEECETCGKPL